MNHLISNGSLISQGVFKDNRHSVFMSFSLYWRINPYYSSKTLVTVYGMYILMSKSQ